LLTFHQGPECSSRRVNGCDTSTALEVAVAGSAPNNAMSLPGKPSCPGHRLAVHLARRASHGSEGLSSACMDDRNSPLSTERRAHSCIPHSECFPSAPESPVACCCLESEIRICR